MTRTLPPTIVTETSRPAAPTPAATPFPARTARAPTGPGPKIG